MHGMNRHATPFLYELLGLFPCVAIVGVRQCGKTTLLEQLPGWRIHDLEKLADVELIARDPDLFFRLNPEHIAIANASCCRSCFPLCGWLLTAIGTVLAGLSSPGRAPPAC